MGKVNLFHDTSILNHLKKKSATSLLPWVILERMGEVLCANWHCLLQCLPIGPLD